MRDYVWLPDNRIPRDTIERLSGWRVSNQFRNLQRRSYDDSRLTFQRTSGHGIYIHCFSGPSPVAGIVIQSNTIRQTGTGGDSGHTTMASCFAGAALRNAAPRIQATIYHNTWHGINLQEQPTRISGNRVSTGITTESISRMPTGAGDRQYCA